MAPAQLSAPKAPKASAKELTAQLAGVQQAMKAAQGLDPLAALPAAFGAYAKNDLNAGITFSTGAELSPAQREAVWRLFEANMRVIYEADSQKWNPSAKKRELFDDAARYLLASDAAGTLLAYTHFRFEVEENLLHEEELARLSLGRYQPVLYCYELQLDPAAQRRGLGKRLMQMLELMALKHGMQAVLLTVQRSNESAAAFYRALGYSQHPSCPERNGFDEWEGEDPGHRIMWKDMRRS